MDERGSLLGFQDVSRRDEIRALREKKIAAPANPAALVQAAEDGHFVVTLSHVNEHFVNV